MPHEQTAYQQMVNGVRQLQAGARRGGGVGVLAVLLLLPLTAAGQDTPAALASPESGEAMEAVAAVAPREGDPDTSFGTKGAVLGTFGDGSSAEAVVIQPDGKIVVAGAANVSGKRYNLGSRGSGRVRGFLLR